MASPILELQVAIIAALRGATGIEAPVYDRVPTNAAVPYISLGPADATSDDADCIKAHTISFQIDVWSREPGFREASEIADAIENELHEAEFSLPVNALVDLRHRQTRRFRDADGITSHVAMTFVAIIERA